MKNDCTVNIFLIFTLHILPTFNDPLVFFFQLYCSVLDPFHYNDMSGCRFISLKSLELHLLICYWYQDSPFLFVCHLLPFFGPLLCLPSPTIQTMQVSDKWGGIFWLSLTFVSNVWVWLRTTVIWSVACHLWHLEPRREVGSVWYFPLSGISGLSFDSPFLSPHFFFCLVPLLFFFLIFLPILLTVFKNLLNIFQ